MGWFCKHRYEPYAETRERIGPVILKRWLVLRCAKCGKTKRKRIQ